jgi:hypothetical protein
MYVVHEKQDRKYKLDTITVNPWEASTGHRRFAAKAGPHKDKRRLTKTSQRIKFRKELD